MTFNEYANRMNEIIRELRADNTAIKARLEVLEGVRQPNDDLPDPDGESPAQPANPA